MHRGLLPDGTAIGGVEGGGTLDTALLSTVLLTDSGVPSDSE